MKKTDLLRGIKGTMILCICTLNLLYAQQAKYQLVCVGFYNLENLFDTIDGPNLDEEFLPGGIKNWTSDKYQDKLNRLSKVLGDLGQDMTKEGPIVLGVCEIENRQVLEDLVKQPDISSRNYQIVHFDSKDVRGVDVALLYQSKHFKVISARGLTVPLFQEDSTPYYTRDILYVEGDLKGEHVHFFVNHWPSRRSGEEASRPSRETAAQVIRQKMDSILISEPDAKIMVMGDLNDNPDNTSLTKYLSAKKSEKKVGNKDMFNPFYANYLNGEGTSPFDDAWGLFDQIILSKGCIKKQGFSYYKHLIFHPNYLFETDGNWKSYPKRTFSGDVYNYGYSDHFPVCIYLTRQIP